MGLAATLAPVAAFPMNGMINRLIVPTEEEPK
jgi:hypothetical protein